MEVCNSFCRQEGEMTLDHIKELSILGLDEIKALPL